MGTYGKVQDIISTIKQTVFPQRFTASVILYLLKGIDGVHQVSLLVYYMLQEVPSEMQGP